MMNNTTLENTLLLLDGNDFKMTAHLASLILQLPLTIYILQLILSRHLITSEFYSLNEAIFVVIICLNDVVGVVECVFPNEYLKMTGQFFLGFVVGGRPCLLMLICVDRYLAVVKPVLFLRLKSLKYKLASSGIIWLWTLIFCLSSILVSPGFYVAVAGQVFMCCLVKLYCCIATLLVLKRPGPGEGAGQREGMCKIKLRAFRIVLIITMSVILVYGPLVILINFRSYISQQQFMKLMNVCYICTTISGVIQALLFLRRFGKLPCIKWP